MFQKIHLFWVGSVCKLHTSTRTECAQSCTDADIGSYPQRAECWQKGPAADRSLQTVVFSLSIQPSQACPTEELSHWSQMSGFSSSNELENCKEDFSLCRGTFSLKKKREQNWISCLLKTWNPSPSSIRQVVREIGRKCMWQNRWLVLIGIKYPRSTFCSENNPSFPFTQPQDESVFLHSVVLIVSCGLSF